MTGDEEREEELFAERIADEAVAGFDRLVSQEAFTAMRDLIIDELLCTDEGRRRLRAARKDPVVQQSTEIARLEDETAAKKASRGT